MTADTTATQPLTNHEMHGSRDSAILATSVPAPALSPAGTEHTAAAYLDDDGYGDGDFESEEPALLSASRGGGVVETDCGGGLGDGIIAEEGEGFRIVKTSDAGDDFQVQIKYSEY